MLKKLSALGLIIASSCFAAEKPAEKVQLTAEQAQELSSLTHKGSLTTGYFECIARFGMETGEDKCIPAELKFQNHVLDTIAAEYKKVLTKPQQDSFTKVEKQFEDYRIARCGWYDRVNLNPKTRMQTAEDAHLRQIRCLLETTVDRVNELESLVMETEN